MSFRKIVGMVSYFVKHYILGCFSKSSSDHGSDKILCHEASAGSVPVLKCRGTYYHVGYQIGHTFKHMIRDLLDKWEYYHTLLKIASTKEGKRLTENSLQLCKRKYPGYVQEIKGMADGVGMDFEKLFLLNIDSILETLEEGGNRERYGVKGCTSITCNKDEVVIGHTEDALAKIKNHVYIISAEILSDKDEDNTERVVLEKFTTFCYAGYLMGYTMGYNHKMIYALNTMFPKVYTAGTPRAFVARALLRASDLPSLLKILKDNGTGIADGFGVNVCFYKDNHNDEDFEHRSNPKTVIYNIEVAPPQISDNGNGKESIVNVKEIHPGKTYVCFNRYVRVKAKEINNVALIWSDRRKSVISKKYKEPNNEGDLRQILSDQSDFDYPIFNNGRADGKDYKINFLRNVSTGFFNIKRRTWKIYTGRPNVSKPVRTFVME